MYLLDFFVISYCGVKNSLYMGKMMRNNYCFCRGKTKSYFKEGWDILKDELPECNNKYYFDKIRGIMLKCET